MSQEGNKNQDTRKPDPGNNADSQAVDKVPVKNVAPERK